MATAKGQIEYKAVHSDYLGVRNNALLNVKNILDSSLSPIKSLLKIICMLVLSSSLKRLKLSKQSIKTRSLVT
jgi:hypothetical protein